MEYYMEWIQCDYFLTWTADVIFHQASGKATFGSDEMTPLETNSLCWIASMTKLVTAVAVMQLVERGDVSLDDDVCQIIPELKDIPVLQSAGHGMELASEGSHLLNGYHHPLLFQPGTSWGYGGGIDWAGRLVRRHSPKYSDMRSLSDTNDGQIEYVTHSTLEKFMQCNIWSKIGATNTTFRPELYQNKLPHQLEMGQRTNGGSGKSSIVPGKIILNRPTEDNLGGIGLFSTATDFAKLLSALLKDGYPLLSKTSTDILFGTQLSEQARLAMPKHLGAQMRRILGIKNVTDVVQADHTLAGTVLLKDIPGRRRKGSINWSGLPNLHWWIDRETGIAAALFTQMMPPGDAAVTSLLIELETALYSRFQVKNYEKKEAFKL
ncbi:esterase [Penicillium macrosclerotiorum]|uniref:esterase n=1 Tax=Penicillium macrosclerotiorum TaxID=303699 RepID=UPI0025482549|nr:esterase [Penicillium macrosclerotiorum]KAJ5682495.1 esterase [Penicillium macrosclerotiorum]